MYRQHRIHRTLTSSEGVSCIQRLLAEEQFSTRTAVARRVCQEYGFYDARGHEQWASCLQALNHLECRQQIALPRTKRVWNSAGVRRLGEPVAAAEAVPARVDQVQGLELQLVTSDRQRWLWNELMAREHPLGAVIHAGAQLRYLVHSAHGYLGALGFSAAALRLACRDDWIGWDEEQRGRDLHRVVCLSRFLIRPSVDCQNLASKVLGQCLRRLSADFQRRYGYRPYVVETFVSEDYNGVSFEASNWHALGQTAGRGRFAEGAVKVSKKSVYVYELKPDWRALLGVWKHRLEPRAVGEGLEIEQWAEQEFGGAPLGDVRLSRRLVKSVKIQSKQPTASFMTAAGGDRAAVLGHYRLIEQPADSEVSAQNMLAVHRRRTLERMQTQPEVLCVQDGTDLNFANRGGCEGLGTIGRNRGSGGTLGMHLHSVLALDAQGVPLGVPHLEYSCNEDKPKTGRWLRGLRHCAELSQQLQQVRVVSVMDREADFFELFAQPEVGREVELLVRAQYNRSLGKGELKLFDQLNARRPQAHLKLRVERQSARRGSRSQKARAAQSAREAKAELRWCEVQLPAPRRKKFRGCKPRRMHAVQVKEIQAPEGVEPLHWFLLTTLPVQSRAQAEQVIQRYRLRWRIEDWHRVLKSGCKVELLAHRTEGRQQRAITINAVIAWRLTVMTLLGRETPELSMAVMFSELEIACLQDFAAHCKLPPPTDLGSAIVTMAILAGYQNRKHDPPPGNQKLWEGYLRLTNMVQVVEVQLSRAHQGQLYKILNSG